MTLLKMTQVEPVRSLANWQKLIVLFNHVPSVIYDELHRYANNHRLSIYANGDTQQHPSITLERPTNTPHDRLRRTNIQTLHITRKTHDHSPIHAEKCTGYIPRVLDVDVADRLSDIGGCPGLGGRDGNRVAVLGCVDKGYCDGGFRGRDGCWCWCCEGCCC